MKATILDTETGNKPDAAVRSSKPAAELEAALLSIVEVGGACLCDLTKERDRYRTALEGIAGFPHQYFDDKAPWKMRYLAESALLKTD